MARPAAGVTGYEVVFGVDDAHLNLIEVVQERVAFAYDLGGDETGKSGQRSKKHQVDEDDGEAAREMEITLNVADEGGGDKSKGEGEEDKAEETAKCPQ